MRIHIEIPPEFNSPYSSSDPDESPLFAKFGGETVLIELQGQLESEGDTAGRLIGVLGMEGERPTLRIAHHLLHGSLVKLAKPLAVLRKAAVQVLPDDEIEREAEKGQDSSDEEGNEEGNEDGDEVADATIVLDRKPLQSSPMVAPPSSALDYSSDLDPQSSPARPPPPTAAAAGGDTTPKSKRKRSLTPTRPDLLVEKKKKRKRSKGGGVDGLQPRATRYDCIGIVKVKVVFSKRPQPIVNPDMDDA